MLGSSNFIYANYHYLSSPKERNDNFNVKPRIKIIAIDTRQDLARSDCTDGLSDWMDERFIFIDNTLKKFYLVFYVFRILYVLSWSL